MLRSMAWMIPPVVTNFRESRSANAASWPAGAHWPGPAIRRCDSTAFSQAWPPSCTRPFSTAQRLGAGQSEDAHADAVAGANNVVSLPSQRAMRYRHSAGTGDSRLRSKAPSRTTPVAPAAMQPAATFGPMPPRTQTGKSVSASTPCKSTKEDSGPHQPPASWPERMSASKPADCASRASARVVTSAIATRPAWRTIPAARAELVPGGRPDRDTDHRRQAQRRGNGRRIEDIARRVRIPKGSDVSLPS